MQCTSIQIFLKLLCLFSFSATHLFSQSANSLQYLFPDNSSRWQNIPSLRNITDITRANSKSLLITTTGGFYFLNFSHLHQVFTKSTSLQNSNFTSSFANEVKEYWIGTKEGTLIKYKAKSNSFKSYTDITRIQEYSEKSIIDISATSDTLFILTDFGLINFNTKREAINELYRLPFFESQKPIAIKLWRGFIVLIFDQSVSFAKASSINLYSSASWQSISIPNIFASEVFNNILFIGTSNGLYQCNTPSFVLNQVKSFTAAPILSLTSFDSKMVASTSNHFFLFDSQPNSETVQDPLIFPLPFQSSSKSIFISKDSILFGEYTDSLYLFSISNKSGFILNSFPSSLFFNEATRIAKDHLNQLHISGLSQSNFFNTSTAKWQRDTVAFNKMIPTPNATFFATKKHGLLKRTSVSTFFKSFGTATPDSEITDLTLNGSILWLCITGKPSLFAFNISDETITEIKIPSLPNHVYPTSIITDDEGRKWLALSHNFGGAVYYDGGTISNTTDDYWLTLNTTSGKGKFPSPKFNGFTKDKLGAIWIATNNGACVFYTPKTDANKERILNATMVSDLAGKVLTAVASDPSGDIWFGSTTGVWVVNSSLTLKNYYSENSTPLLSNRINQIYFDPQQGQMIFATNKGVSSLFIDTYKPSTSASFLSSFPSPFRIPSDAPVIIHGLMENANINILTASGKHVRTIEKATSGGASWDGKDDNGQWVSSGIYLIVAYESNSKTTSIGKLAVIRGN